MSGRGTRGGSGGRGGGGSDRGGAGVGSASRGRGRGTPQRPPEEQSRPLSGASTPTRTTAPSTSRPQTSLESEFPSLQISSQPGVPAWGPRPQARPAQPTPVQQAPVQPPPVQPTMVQPAPVQKTEPKPAEKVEEIKSVLITEPEESAVAEEISTEFPKKPTQRGDLGRLIKLRTNHYRITLQKPFLVYQYDVEVKRKQREGATSKEADKEIKNKQIMRDMFLKLSKKLPAQYTNKMVYNFSKNLYSLVALPFEESIFYELEIENSVYIVKLKKINQVMVNPACTDLVSIQVLDLIFTQTFNYTCVNLNRSFFKEGADFKELNFGLELWKGAYASVRPSEIGLTWNIDSANAAFLTSQNLLDVASFHYNCDYNRIKEAIQKDKDGNVFGVSFLDSYSGRDIKTKTGGFRKKIKGFGPDSTYKFDWKQANGQTVKISIKDYLKQHYNIDLKYPNLPCVDLGKQSYLPMELCMTELKNKKKLDERETQEMIKIAAVRAPDRMNYIQNWAQHSEIEKDPVLKEYNISLNLRMVEIDGRVLEPPDVQYGNNRAQSRQIGERGSWDHRNYKFTYAVQIQRWVVVNYAFRVREEAAYNFVDALIRIGKIHGMVLKDPLDFISDTRKSIRDEDYRRMMENLVSKHKNLDLIVVFFGGTTNAYKIIKTAGDLTYGVATQGVEDRNVNRINDQTISNILLKINTKCGGINFILGKESRLFAQYIQQLYNGPLMVFGADVTHPGPGETSITESIAAVVGSLDKECSYYAARLFAQKHPKGQAYEMIHDLNEMFISLLQEHFNRNKTYPKKIVFYRDGVSEGQFPLVIRHEMNKIRAACVKINPAYKPAITFVVVQKRHHTRFFPVNQNDLHGKAQNVPPGTVVDRAIVTPHLFDFFLCSHSGIQGTSKPCRYFVLHDDNNFSMNQMQILSHYLCHIYSRCPRSVSYPAPAYYSHLAAFRGRDYIRKIQAQTNPRAITSYEIELHPNIRNKMFYT